MPEQDKPEHKMHTPPDWEAFINVSEDGLAVVSDADDILWVVTADDPDQTGEVYRVWMIPPSVEQLPSSDVQEVLPDGEPLLMSSALRVIADLVADFRSDADADGDADGDGDGD